MVALLTLTIVMRVQVMVYTKSWRAFHLLKNFAASSDVHPEY